MRAIIREVQAIGRFCYEAGIYDPLIDYCVEQDILVVITRKGSVYGPITFEDRCFTTPTGRSWSKPYLRSPWGWFCPRESWEKAGSPPQLWIGAEEFSSL